MSQFSVYRIGDGYAVDVQADLLKGLSTRLVVPLLPLVVAPKPIARLNPIFAVQDEALVLATQFMASVPLNQLGQPVTSLADHYFEIKNALDMLIDGI